MMTDCLIKILYVPVVLQSLCNFAIKPKMAIQTALFLLFNSIMNIKDQKLNSWLVELCMGTQMSQEMKDLMNQKDLY